MKTFLATLSRQAFFGKPVNAWGYDKDFHFIVEAPSLRDALAICFKQCGVFNAQLPDGHRFVAGPIRENPGEDTISRLNPEKLADPDPETAISLGRHPLWYIALDDESRFHPKDKTGKEMPVIVLQNGDTGETVYTSAADGRLYMTHGADKKRAIAPERLEMIAAAFPFSPVMLAFAADGSIDFEHTIPDLTRLPLSRMWVEGQENMP